MSEGIALKEREKDAYFEGVSAASGGEDEPSIVRVVPNHPVVVRRIRVPREDGAFASLASVKTNTSHRGDLPAQACRDEGFLAELGVRRA